MMEKTASHWERGPPAPHSPAEPRSWAIPTLLAAGEGGLVSPGVGRGDCPKGFMMGWGSRYFHPIALYKLVAQFRDHLGIFACTKCLLSWELCRGLMMEWGSPHAWKFCVIFIPKEPKALRKPLAQFGITWEFLPAQNAC